MFSVYSVGLKIKPGIQSLCQQMRVPFTQAKCPLPDKPPLPFVVNIVRKEMLKIKYKNMTRAV